MHEWIWLWRSSCRTFPVLQQNRDSEYEQVLGMDDSCFRLVLVYGRCLQSLFLLMLAGSESWL